jgi:hypothetical protein
VSQALSPYIKHHDAILMQNHGAVAYGPSLERAYLNMESVEALRHDHAGYPVARQMQDPEPQRGKAAAFHKVRQETQLHPTAFQSKSRLLCKVGLSRHYRRRFCAVKASGFHKFSITGTLAEGCSRVAASSTFHSLFTSSGLLDHPMVIWA